MPISFRYEVSFPDSGKTHMFKPNPLEKEAAKHVSFGAAYASLGYDKIESSTRMQVVWEAWANCRTDRFRAFVAVAASGGDANEPTPDHDEEAEVLVDLQVANGAPQLVQAFRIDLMPEPHLLSEASFDWVPERQLSLTLVRMASNSKFTDM